MLTFIRTLAAVIDILVPKRLQQRARGPVVMPTILNPRRIYRSYLAWRYLRGDGLEIGALHLPLPVFSNARVRYVDRHGLDDLRRHYPEMNGLPLVSPDIIDNGERLDTIAPLSQDFIIANHFLEHAEDPITTLTQHLFKLKIGGILYLAIPVREFSFDKSRPLTTLEHLQRDCQTKGAESRSAHYREWAELVEGVCGDTAIGKRAEELQAKCYSIHFHVWDATAFSLFLAAMQQELPVRFAVVHYIYSPHNPQEAIALLKRLN